jgi:hypothetical protein
METVLRLPKIEKSMTITSAAVVTSRRSCGCRGRRGFGLHASADGLADQAEGKHVVVRREPE